MIALICSVDREADRLFDSKPETIAEQGSKRIVRGSISGNDVLLCVSGMGKVNACHAATLLTRFDPTLFLLFGIGGGYVSSGAAVGDVALCCEEIAADEGVLTREGFKDAGFIGIPLVKTATSSIYSTFHAPEPFVSRSLSLLLGQVPGKLQAVHAGTFVTLSTCTGTKERAAEIEQRHHGLCENMEGAAVAQVAELHTMPWLEVRGISNLVEDRNLGAWDIPAAVNAVQNAVRILAGGLAPA